MESWPRIGAIFALAFLAAYAPMQLLTAAGAPGWLVATVGTVGCWAVFLGAERKDVASRVRDRRRRHQYQTYC